MISDKSLEVPDKEYVNELVNAEPIRHTILSDPELEGLTLYEKKAFIVNRELDSHGMGKYQWWIFGLCGFGYGTLEPYICQSVA